MSLLPDKFTGGLASFGDGSPVSKRTLLKSQVATMTIWLGQRSDANDDLEIFHRMLYIYGFKPAVQFEKPDAHEIDDPQILRSLTLDLIPSLDIITDPLAVFTIMTATVTEKPWSTSFCEAIRQYRWQTRNLDDTAVYQIIMDARGSFDRELFGSYYTSYYDLCDSKQEPRFRPEENIARECGAFFLHFDPDFPTAGCRRLVHFMNRVLGYDLPGEEFPAYSFDEITKIAWNINREAPHSKPGSVPKYPIGSDGKPIFPF